MPVRPLTACALGLTLLAAPALAKLPTKVEGDASRAIEQAAVARTGTGLLLSAFQLPGSGAPVVAVVHRKDSLAVAVLRGDKLTWSVTGVADMPLLEGLVDDVSVRDVTLKDIDGDRSDEVVVTIQGTAPFFRTGTAETQAMYVFGITPKGEPTLQLAHERAFRGTMQETCESHSHARTVEHAPEDMLGDDHPDLRITTRQSKRDCEAPTKPCSGEELRCKTVNSQSQGLWIWEAGAYRLHEE
jgi:hypothetical protein